MTSTLGHALLGLLADRPTTGYDLARRLRRPVGYFWAAGHSQIYPELARLEESGLVLHEVVEGAGPRLTKRYGLTAAGRRALRFWLLSTSPDVDEREILLRVYLLFTLSPAEAATVVAAVREHHRLTLEHYRAIERDPEHLPWGVALTSTATLDWGIRFEEGRIAWCDELIADFRDRAATAGG